MLESENSLRIVVVLLEKSLKMSVYGNFLEKGELLVEERSKMCEKER